MRDALGLTSDRVYRWRLLLQEYGPEIVYIKGIHNTVADAISRLEYNPSVNKTAESYLMMKVKGNSQSVQRQNWLTLSKHWSKVETDDTTKYEDLNLVFATHGEEDEIYPLTIIVGAAPENSCHEEKKTPFCSTYAKNIWQAGLALF